MNALLVALAVLVLGVVWGPATGQDTVPGGACVLQDGQCIYHVVLGHNMKSCSNNGGERRRI